MLIRHDSKLYNTEIDDRSVFTPDRHRLCHFGCAHGSPSRSMRFFLCCHCLLFSLMCSFRNLFTITSWCRMSFLLSSALIAVATLCTLGGVSGGSTTGISPFFSFCRPRKLPSQLTTSEELMCLGSNPVALHPLISPRSSPFYENPSHLLP
jgi:hypothetical protein